MGDCSELTEKVKLKSETKNKQQRIYRISGGFLELKRCGMSMKNKVRWLKASLG
jgi:hypothetical protein